MKNELSFVDEGSGEPTLVFLHYFGGSSRTWKAVVEILKDRFHCIAIDLPGFGDSAPLKKPTVENVTVKVIEAIEELELKNYVLVGHSMGGKMAAFIASTEPKALRSLILVAPSPPTPEPMTDKQRKDLLSAYGDKTTLKKSAEGLVAKPLSQVHLQAIVADNLRIDKTAWDGWLNEGSQEDVSSQMKNIAVPLAVISGDSDPNFSTKFLQETFRRYFPNPSFVEIKNSGHLIPIEQPQVLADAIIRFLPTPRHQGS